MNWQRRLFSALDVQPAEERPVGLLLLLSFFLGIPLTFTEAAANTLLLLTFGASALPYVYIGFACVSVVTGVCYARLEARLSFARLLVGTIAMMALSLVVLRLGLALPWRRWVVAALAVWCELLWVLAGICFGALLGRLFTLRQGKRLFGLVGSGEVLAGILGGLLVPPALLLVGTANLLLLAALSLAAALLLLPALLRELPAQAEASSEPEPAHMPLGRLLRSRYPLLLIGFAAFALLSYFVLDTIFYIQLDLRFQNDRELASFLGLFFAVVGGLTLIGRGLLSGRMLQRYGLAGGLLAMPLAMALGAALVLGSGLLLGGLGLFWLIMLSKLLNEVLRDAADTPASLILYQPLAPAERLRAQALVETVVEPTAAGLAGALLILLISQAGLGTLGLTLLLGALLAITLALGHGLSRAYHRVLTDALMTRRISGPTFALQDSSTRAILRQALQRHHPAEVLFALDLLEQGDDPELAALLCGLLDHQLPTVRREAFARLERLQPPEALPAVRARLAIEADPEVLEAGLRAFAMLSEDEALEVLAGWLDAPERSVRRGAMVGLLRNGGISGVLVAGERLTQLSRSASPDDRALAAEILGAVAIRNFYQPLVPLLDDDEPEVRRAALQAAGQIAHPRLWPAVVAALANPELRAAAEGALSRAGAELPRIMQAHLGRDDLPQPARIRLTRICGRNGSAAMAAALLPYLETPNSLWRTELYRALLACHITLDTALRERVDRQLRREAALAGWMLAARHDIAGLTGAELLRRALEHAFLQARTRLLLLLGLLFDPRLTEQARLALEYGAPDQRAYAVESLDGLLPGELKALLPLLEELPLEEQLRRLRASLTLPAHGPLARLRALAAGDEAPAELWLRCCACYVLGQHGDADSRRALLNAAAASDPLLRETALHALGRAERPAREGAAPMLSTIEKVLILKTVSIFATTADDVLLEIAPILTELEVPAGEQIFAKGDQGTSMYIIISGRVRVHDGDRTLNELGPRAVFGEMAMLDPEPRIATVTALEPCQLFRIDHGPFYQVMADRVEVARGIIQVLIGHLRARVRDLSLLHQRVDELERVVEQSAVPDQ